MEKQTIDQTHPALCEQWDHELNGDLLPRSITHGSKKKVWWRCKEGHQWEAVVKNRTANQTGCPYCSGFFASKDRSIIVTHPHLIDEWDYEANEENPENLSANSKKKVWWKCKSGISDHKWETTVQNRTQAESGCPCCCNRKVVPSNCLATTHPALCKQWHPHNPISPKEVTAGSTTKIIWQCSVANDHQWVAPINTRVIQETGCPHCSGKKASSTNNLKDKFPEIATEWHIEFNERDLGISGPEKVPYGSAIIAHWQCRKDPKHIWKASVNNRTNKTNPCPYCAGKKADSSTSLLASYPNICVEWDWEKNKLDPNHLLPNSHNIVHWICKNNPSHLWRASSNNRVANKSGCPFCMESKGEELIQEHFLKRSICFLREHRIIDCRDKRSLPFDFAIFSNGNITGLIEYQGHQHFNPIDYFGGTSTFEGIQRRDLIKRDYCKEKGIPLLEIHHNSVSKIPQILDDFLETLQHHETSKLYY